MLTNRVPDQKSAINSPLSNSLQSQQPLPMQYQQPTSNQIIPTAPLPQLPIDSKNIILEQSENRQVNCNVPLLIDTHSQVN